MSNNRGITYSGLATKQQISASTTTAKATNPVGNYTTLVYIFNQNTSGVAYVNFGLTGGAATAANGFPIGAGQGHYLQITPGQFVHVLLSTGSATVDVCEMSA